MLYLTMKGRGKCASKQERKKGEKEKVKDLRCLSSLSAGRRHTATAASLNPVTDASAF